MKNVFETFDKLATVDATPERLFDLSTLRLMCEGDKKFMLRMINVFMNDVPPYVEIIKNGIAERDLEKVRLAAHRIKPSIQHICNQSIGDDIAWIEKMAEEKKWSVGLEKKIQQFSKNISETMKQLKIEKEKMS